MTRDRFSGAGFLKTYAVPALFILLIPGVGIWFASHATGRIDRMFQDGVLSQIRQDEEASAEEKARAMAFYTSTPLSMICRGGSPQLDELAQGFDEACGESRQFAWIHRLSQASIVIGLLAFLFASMCVAFSLRSQRALHRSFVAGWQVLKVAALLQAVAQGIVIVLLSYWMTVVWFDRYVPKLILFTGIGAGAVVLLLVRAIFKKIDTTNIIEGTLLTPAMAPRFWAHVRAMCARLGTEPPQQIVAGVDDNFFVTENRVLLNGTPLDGRTLFISFSLLKFLEKDEADAVLAHEMAHFSGEDTLYTRKMSPLLARYGEYLSALYDGGLLCRPLFHFMHLFWALFQLSINRMSRQREFRADNIAAGATSPAAMGRALVKVMAYASYRARIEQALFSENARQEQVAIAGRVSAGFASYVSSPSLLGDLGGASFPHPFDSHPKLDARLVAVRAPIVPSHYAGMLLQPVTASWLHEIDGADELEQKMWAAYEQQFAAAHEESLAWRYRPDTDEQRAIVEKYFPAQQLTTKKTDAQLTFTFAEVSFTEWEGGAVSYDEIAECAARESFGRKFLTIKLNTPRKKVEIPLHRFADGSAVVGMFERYYGRHTHACRPGLETRQDT